MSDPAVENAVAREVLAKMETVEVSKDLLAQILDKTMADRVPPGWNLDAPMTLDEQMKAAELVAKTEFCPKDYKGKPENVMVAALYGRDLGLKYLQSLWCIAVINGRPCVWGDGALAVVLASGQVEDFKELCGSDALAAGSGFCQIKRKGRASWVQVKFTREDAELAGLWGKAGPWQNYPGRMMQMRARGFALRDGFADVLKGMVFVEETADYAGGLLSNTRAAMEETERQRAPESRSEKEKAAAAPVIPAAPAIPPAPAPVPASGVGKPQPTAPGGLHLPNPWKGKLKAVETLSYDRPHSEAAIKADPKLKGKTVKQNWYRLVAQHDGKEVGFATYSETAADLASTAAKKATEVEISWEHTGKPNLRVKSISPVLPSDDKAAKKEEKPADAHANDPGFGPEEPREPGQEG